MKPVNYRLDDGTIKAILQAERTAALGADTSSDLSDQRIRNFEYYVGDMSSDMPSADGESSAVSTDVSDVVDGVLPIVLDVFVGEDKVIEFTPVGAGDEAAAEQETDYVNHVFYQQNNGFLILHNAFKDAFLSKNCYIKWWMEKEEVRERERYEGLTEDAFGDLAADTDVTIIDLETYQMVDPATQQPATCYNAVVESVRTKSKPKIAAFPPEEFAISKAVRGDLQAAPYFAHTQRKAQADVISDFPDKEDIIRRAATSGVGPDNVEAQARETVEDEQDLTETADSINKEMRLLEVTEHYIRLALENDKVARRYKITTVGSAYDILDIEEVTAWNVASGTSIIMPHRHFGRALADLVVDIQRIKTSLLRATLNNAYYANNQRVEVSETHASENTIDDLLNNRVGGIVRTKMPGGLNQLETQPIGHWTLPVVEYFDGVRESRTGVSKNNTGLDVDSLNHARTGAVERIMSAAELRVKLMARILAETLIVDTFSGLHRMLQEHSEEQEVFKLRGQWVNVNPREWKNRNHMTVSLPLGGASKQQMLGFWAQMLGIQKEALASGAGPNGPLVSWQNIYNTVEQMTKLVGVKSVDPFLMRPPPPNTNAPPPPDPKMLEANAKAQAMQQQTQAGIAADQEKAKNALAIEQLREQAKRQREQDEFAHKAALDKMQAQHDMAMEQFRTGAKMRLEAFEAQEKMKIDREQAALQAKQGVGEV